NLEAKNYEGARNDEGRGGDGDKEVNGRGYGAQVSSRIDRVCSDKSEYHRVKDGVGVMMAHDAGQATAGYHGRLGADELDRGHHRKRHRSGPEGGKAQSGAGARVGCNPGRVIVGGAGDDAWSDYFQSLEKEIGFALSFENRALGATTALPFAGRWRR